jgi:hypothetical protein
VNEHDERHVRERSFLAGAKYGRGLPEDYPLDELERVAKMYAAPVEPREDDQASRNVDAGMLPAMRAIESRYAYDGYKRTREAVKYAESGDPENLHAFWYHSGASSALFSVRALLERGGEPGWHTHIAPEDGRRDG